MKVDIIRVADEFDLEQNVTVNFVVFRLPSGRVVRALIGEADMKAIIEDKVRLANTAPQQVMVAPTQPAAPAHDPGEMPAPRLADDEMVTVFGGDGGGGEAAEFDQVPGFEPPQAAAPPAYQPPLQRPQPPRPQRVVQKDEWGNPIVRQAGGVNPDELVGGDFEGTSPG